MALPTHVAPDELIESAWGNAVVDSLNAHDAGIVNLNTAVTQLRGRLAQVVIAPASSTDGTSDTWQNLIVVNNVLTVPSWATAVMLTTHMTGLTIITAASVIVFCNAITGANDDRELALITGNPAQGYQTSWCHFLTGITPGLKNLAIRYRRGTATGGVRINTQTKITISAIYSA